MRRQKTAGERPKEEDHGESERDVAGKSVAGQTSARSRVPRQSSLVYYHN